MTYKIIFPIAVLAIQMFVIGQYMAKIDQPKSKDSNKFANFLWSFIGIGLLIGSGFFNTLRWPQLVIGCLTVIDWSVRLNSSPSQKTEYYNAGEFAFILFWLGMVNWIYYCGGAFQYLTW